MKTRNDMPRTEVLLRRSKLTDRFYQSQLTGEKVSTSICTRIEEGTPLNKIEAEFFPWLKKNEWFVENLVCKYTDKAMAKRSRWSLAPVWERARWDSIIDLGDEPGDYKVNDHHRCYLSRYLNEIYDRPFFMIRTVSGEEVLYSDSEWEEKFGDSTATVLVEDIPDDYLNEDAA